MKQFFRFSVAVFLLFPTFINAQNTLPTSGNVGIGTSTPSVELEVMGTTKMECIKVSDTAYFDKPVIIRDSVTLEKKLTVDQDINIKGESVFVGDAIAKGNFNILGTTQMKGDAFVEGTFNFTGLEDLNVTDERFLMIKSNGKAVTMEKGALGNLLYDVDNGTACITGDDAFGNVTYTAPIWQPTAYGVIYTGTTCPAKVGIGVSNPKATFDTRGTAYISSNVGIGVIPTNDARLSVSQVNPTKHSAQINFITTSQNTTGNALQIVLNRDNRKALNVNNEVMDVFSVFGDGRTVLRTANTTEPALKIMNDNLNEDVFRVYSDGYIEAKRLRLSLNIWADYVFEEGYKLLSIGELEEFINLNGHLPNVPTAETVIKEGVDMGEMDAILLEKIEELSLYIIDLQNQLNEVNSNQNNK
jgi:cytoskeletal protein CcmA (bactofilin family)